MSYDISTEGRPVPAPARAGAYAGQRMPLPLARMPFLDNVEIDQFNGDKPKKSALLKVESASVRGQKLNQYAGAVVYGVIQKVKDAYSADKMLPLNIFSSQYVHPMGGFVLTMPPSVYEAILFIGVFKAVGDDDNTLTLSSSPLENDPTKAKVVGDVLFGFAYPVAGATDTASEVEELVRVGLRNVGLELSHFDQAKGRDGILRNFWNIRFRPDANGNIDGDIIFKLRSVPLTAPSGAPVNVVLAGEFCKQIGVCPTCYRKGSCWCSQKGAHKRAKMPSNSEAIQRRMIQKQRTR